MEDCCGVFGVFAPGGELARLTTYALYALQHRGQDGAGIALSDGQKIHLRKGPGLVSGLLPQFRELEEVPACAAIGHVRYPSTANNRLEDAQPLLLSYHHGSLAVAQNGRLVNGSELRKKLEKEGSIFQTTTDSELIAHLIARYGPGDFESSLRGVLPQLRGAYSFLFLSKDKLICVRDPYGIRPLSLGTWQGHYVLASESCAFDTIGAELLRDVRPGEMIVIDREGLNSWAALPVDRVAHCIFEYIYIARPDSNIAGKNVHLVRKELGRQLAREQPAAADIVAGVPDSSLAAASGYAEELGLPYEIGLIKNRYIGRTFIRPGQQMRDLGVRLKLNPVQKVVEGKRIVIVDDSIVRGTTCKRLVDMFNKAGAREVHLRISSPPVISPCYYGVDTPTCGELIGYRREVEEIRAQIGATTLGYLSCAGMIKAVGLPADHFCIACFNGDYPVLPDGK